MYPDSNYNEPESAFDRAPNLVAVVYHERLGFIMNYQGRSTFNLDVDQEEYEDVMERTGWGSPNQISVSLEICLN